MNVPERREMERFPLDIEIYQMSCNGSAESVSADFQVENICAGGAYINTDSPFPLGTDVKLNIKLPFDKFKELGGRSSRIDVAGSVVRADTHGMAVCFDKKFNIVPNASKRA